MKSIIFTVFFFISLESVLQTQWNKLNTGFNDYIFSVCFINSQTGFVGGQSGLGRIYKTTDSGLNWALSLQTLSDERFEALYFINSMTGWAGSYYGLIYKTTNSGANWLPYAVYGRVRRIHFLNQSTGFAATSLGVKKTSNGGLSWFTVLNVSECIGIRFFNTETGLVSVQGSSISKIFKTVNSGVNWQEVYNEPQGTGINNFSFINSTTGFASGFYKITLKTVDQGSTWNLIYKDPGTVTIIYDHRMIHFVDNNLGYACGQYIIPGPTTYRGAAFNVTTNGGLSWEFQTINPAIHNVYAFEDIQIIDGQIGYITGSNGNIYKSTNAGYVPVIPIASEIPVNFSLHQNYPNPFNPSTKIKFEIPADAAGNTRLSVYDILGREVRTLVNSNLKPGIYESDFNASDLPSGMYFYKLVSGNFSAIKKMIIVK